MRIHVRAIHNGVKSKCEICGKEFNRAPEMRRHRKAVHKIAIIDEELASLQQRQTQALQLQHEQLMLLDQQQDHQQLEQSQQQGQEEQPLLQQQQKEQQPPQQQEQQPQQHRDQQPHQQQQQRTLMSGVSEAFVATEFGIFTLPTLKSLPP